MDPKQEAVAAEFDKYRDRYSATVSASLGIPFADVDYFTGVKVGFLLDYLKREFGSCGGLSVLDVGCGIGNYHERLVDCFRKLSGVDVSTECLKVARQRNPQVEYQCYDGFRLPYNDGEVDAVFAICVVHHVPTNQWQRFFQELSRVTRSGGRVLIFEHNPLNVFTRRIVDRCPFDADAVLIGQRKTRSLLAKAGLVDVSSRTILSVPSIGPATRRLDRMLGRLPFGAQYLSVGTSR